MGASSRCRLFIRLSFQGANAQRTVGNRRADGRRCQIIRRRRRVGDVVEKCSGRYEEEPAGNGSTEIEYAVVIARRAPDKHVLQHLLNGAWRATVADEVGAELTLRDAAERHVVAEDLALPAVLFNHRERAVRASRLGRLIQLNVGEL